MLKEALRVWPCYLDWTFRDIIEDSLAPEVPIAFLNVFPIEDAVIAPGIDPHHRVRIDPLVLEWRLLEAPCPDTDRVETI
jgi:hypothetical protein